MKVAAGRWLSLALLAIVALLALACGGGAQGQRLLVINQNILHGIINEDPEAEPFDRFPERIQLIAQSLAQARPDIVVLQEVLVSGEEDYGDVRAILLGALGEEYRAVFGDITGAPIDEGALGQMTLTRLPVFSSENRHIGGPRSIHRVTVRTERGLIDIYNTHLEGTGAITEAGEDAAVVEIEAVLRFINETRSGTGPVILAGDFNAEPEDASIERLRDAGFIDVLAEGGDPTCERAGDPGCTNSTIPLGEPGNRADRRIDYIFVLPGEDLRLEVSEASLFNNEPVDLDGGVLWPSDHIGVRAVLELE